MPNSMTASDDSGSQDDLYGESDPQEKSIDQEEHESMMHTALVPIKVLQDSPDEEVKEGDEIVVKVKAVHGEEAEIMYAPKKEKEGKGESGGDNYMEESNNELDSMSKE